MQIFDEKYPRYRFAFSVRREFTEVLLHFPLQKLLTETWLGTRLQKIKVNGLTLSQNLISPDEISETNWQFHWNYFQVAFANTK